MSVKHLSLFEGAWVTGLLAVAELLLGFLLLGFPFVLGASTVWVCGFVLGIGGIVRLVQALMLPGNRLWNLAAAVIYLALGVVMVMLPVFSMEVATIVIGWALLAGGVLRLLLAVSLHRRGGIVWRVLNGVISAALGGLIIWGWPDSSLWLIGTMMAVEMIFSGWTLLFLSMAPEPAVQ